MVLFSHFCFHFGLPWPDLPKEGKTSVRRKKLIFSLILMKLPFVVSPFIIVYVCKRKLRDMYVYIYIYQLYIYYIYNVYIYNIYMCVCVS